MSSYHYLVVLVTCIIMYLETFLGFFYNVTIRSCSSSNMHNDVFSFQFQHWAVIFIWEALASELICPKKMMLIGELSKEIINLSL